MRKILAVSGGVDSMVLFDLMVNRGGDIIVAHFDHGTRPSSKTDAEFVQKTCSETGVECVVGRGELGENASEAAARAARYEFLRKVAKNRGGEIYTAHHLDDLTESVAINLLRGTGWRGLAPMGNTEVRRPLLEQGWRRRDILRYAGERGLRFRQDPTNHEDKYLRNRVRAALNRGGYAGAEKSPEEVKMAKNADRDEAAEKSDGDVEKLVKFSRKQGKLREEIEKIVAELLPKDGIYQREWFLKMPDAVAVEILREGALREEIRMTRPQLYDFLEAVRNYPPEKAFNLPGGRLVKLHKTWYNYR